MLKTGFLIMCLFIAAPAAFGAQTTEAGRQLREAAGRVAAAATQLKSQAAAMVGRSTPQSLATLRRPVAAAEAELEYLVSHLGSLTQGGRAADLTLLQKELSFLRKQKESLKNLLLDKQNSQEARDKIARRLATIGDQTFGIAQSIASGIPRATPPGAHLKIPVKHVSSPLKGPDAVQQGFNPWMHPSGNSWAEILQRELSSGQGLSPEEVAEIANAIGRGGDTGMAIATVITMAIAEVSTDPPMAKQHVDQARSLARAAADSLKTYPNPKVRPTRP